jgi:phosphoribosyl-ATP pyrophosphohydrolase
MKKQSQSFILVVILLVINCASGMAQIEGKWKCNIEKSKGALYETDAFKKIKEEAKTDSSAIFALSMMEGVFEAFVGVVLEYKKGGEYIETTITNNEYVKNKVKIKKGKWYFDQKKKILRTVLENGREEETTVKSYSKEELVLELRDNLFLYLLLVE